MKRIREKLGLFEREDWQMFLSPATLGQKAGAPQSRLRAVAVKELVDNALDTGTEVFVSEDGDTITVTDKGPGMDADQVARFFAVNRPMTTSKLWKVPTRGTLGNGLRVVTGAAYASGGKLVVESRGQRHKVIVDPATGLSTVSTSPGNVRTGMAVHLTFGDAIPSDVRAMLYADQALALLGPCFTGHVPIGDYTGKTFTELMRAARDQTVGQIAARFGADVDDQRDARTLPPAAVTDLFDNLKASNPDDFAIVPVGEDAFPGLYSQQARGNSLVEIWVEADPGTGHITPRLLVNRTPIVAELSANLHKRELNLHGCGLNYRYDKRKVPSTADYTVTINITSGTIGLMTDGKAPDLDPFWSPIAETMTKLMAQAARRLDRKDATGIKIKEAVCVVAKDAYMDASAGNRLPANMRQLFYEARPYILQRTGLAKFGYKYFCDCVRAYREDHDTGHWDLIYDARGNATEPHTGMTVPLGTVGVRTYLVKPEAADPMHIETGIHTVKAEARYNTVLFIEKEGFNELMQAARIAERFDTMIMSTKGTSVTAARELIDELAGDNPNLKVLVAHDFDFNGVNIWATLSRDTVRYQYRNNPTFIDIGLRLDDARAMGLQDEIGTYPGDKDVAHWNIKAWGYTDPEADFLIGQKRRIELNAMKSDQFVAWLEGHLRRHAVKVVPDRAIIKKRARYAAIRARIRKLVEAHKADLESAPVELPDDIEDRIAAELEAHQEWSWERALEEVMRDE